MMVYIRKINWYVFVISVLLILAGFVYDILFAGIPYQDAPGHLEQAYNWHKNVSSVVLGVGLYGMSLSIVVWALMEK